MADQKVNINYLNKDFNQFKTSLVDYAKTYFPTVYNDFTPSSPGMMFMEMSKSPAVENANDIPLSALVPAFITSELKTAFTIGFLIYIPFIIIDLVVASVLMSMGMMMLSPMMISMPFKLLLFVLVDGWGLVTSSLVATFVT